LVEQPAHNRMVVGSSPAGSTNYYTGEKKMCIINRLTKKCVFCGSRKNTEYIAKYDQDGKVRSGTYFHRRCLREVSSSPEIFPIEAVDMAVDIRARLKKKERDTQTKEGYRKKQIEFLKTLSALDSL
jgi:hypothetical protein